MTNMKNNSKRTEYQLQTFTYPVPSTYMSQLPNDFPVSYQPNHARLGFLCASSQRWWCFVRFWRHFFIWRPRDVVSFSVEICIILGKFGVIFRFHVNKQIIKLLYVLNPNYGDFGEIFLESPPFAQIIVTTPNYQSRCCFMSWVHSGKLT